MDSRGRYGHHQAHGDTSRAPYPDRSPKYPPPEPRERQKSRGHPEAHPGVPRAPPRPGPQAPRGQQGRAHGERTPDHARETRLPEHPGPSHTGSPQYSGTSGPSQSGPSHTGSPQYSGTSGPSQSGPSHTGSPQYSGTSGPSQSGPSHTGSPQYSGTSGPSQSGPSHTGSPQYSGTSGPSQSGPSHTGSPQYSGTWGPSPSGLELSQYINGGAQSHGGPHAVPPPPPEPLPVAPLKYAIPHAVVSFGTAGQLLRVSPGLSTKENQLEIHSLEVILRETQDQLDMRTFPGPLAREDLHKVDAIEFAHQRASSSLRDASLQDSASVALLWKLLILLCRQNGQIVGSDIAELLLQNPSGEGRSEGRAPMLIDFSEGPALDTEPCVGDDDLLTGSSPHGPSPHGPAPHGPAPHGPAPHGPAQSSRQALQKYTSLLLAGRKKEALEWAMSAELWGHALFLASKMDQRSYAAVLNRFTGQLTSSDPLQTLFQLLSGKTPTVSMEKWGDWKPHLAVMLANETADPSVQRRAVVVMGDTLASRGLFHAAHVCYLTALVPWGFFTQKTDRLVLLGSSSRSPFSRFAQNAALQCTELFEYSQNLGGKYFSIPSFQVYKLLYATRLLDWGLASQAFHYCELIGQSLLRHDQPLLVLTGELADRLKHGEGQQSPGPPAPCDPHWLQQLRLRLQNPQVTIPGAPQHAPNPHCLLKEPINQWEMMTAWEHILHREMGALQPIRTQCLPQANSPLPQPYAPPPPQPYAPPPPQPYAPPPPQPYAPPPPQPYAPPPPQPYAPPPPQPYAPPPPQPYAPPPPQPYAPPPTQPYAPPPPQPYAPPPPQPYAPPPPQPYAPPPPQPYAPPPPQPYAPPPPQPYAPPPPQPYAPPPPQPYAPPPPQPYAPPPTQPYAPPPPQPYAPPPTQPYAPPPAPSDALDQQLDYHNSHAARVTTSSLAAAASEGPRPASDANPPASDANPPASGFLPTVPLEEFSEGGSDPLTSTTEEHGSVSVVP
ncbi:hypothetical protein NHX12_033554 [Muraenolepis orangiensis]|uniref:Sec16 Sec23-binding domain-containing protein n=1 Tax=Muraenolepis orangiensis TaxID=630683 RepID=A0A9Q0E5S1_9TELE|nr:hypothetical protein NHX12_033554 [Muraenolepis orangiensis]